MRIPKRLIVTALALNLSLASGLIAEEKQLDQSFFTGPGLSFLKGRANDFNNDPVYVEPSKDRILQPGERIAGSNYERVMLDYTLQRLAENVYWTEVALYQSTFIVGRRGVLVIDPLSGGNGQKLLAAIREVTELPVTHVMYSHFHYDHVGDVNFFADLARARGKKLRIIGTRATARQIKRYPGRVPLPTRVLRTPRARFRFGGHTILVGTPRTGHSPDNSWILLKEAGILHFVDMVHPGQLEFSDFGLAEEFKGYEDSLREVLKLNWQILNPGHANIGSRRDVELILEYIGELRTHTAEVMGNTPFGPFIQENVMVYGWFGGHRDAVALEVVERMRPRWGNDLGFELVALSHARTVYWELYLH